MPRMEPSVVCGVCFFQQHLEFRDSPRHLSSGCTGLGWRGLQLWGEGAVLPRKVGEELSDWRRGASGALWAQPSMGGSVGVNAGNSCDLVVGPGSLWGMEEQGNRRPDSVLLGIVGESL